MQRLPLHVVEGGRLGGIGRRRGCPRRCRGGAPPAAALEHCGVVRFPRRAGTRRDRLSKGRCCRCRGGAAVVRAAVVVGGVHGLRRRGCAPPRRAGGSRGAAPRPTRGQSEATVLPSESVSACGRRRSESGSQSGCDGERGLHTLVGLGCPHARGAWLPTRRLGPRCSGASRRSAWRGSRSVVGGAVGPLELMSDLL